VVNLAGEPIAGGRWNDAVRAEILDSRVRATKVLVYALRALAAQGETLPRALVQTSAVGFYGTSPVERFEESSSSGKDYLSLVCREWEAAAAPAEALGVRLVVLRSGIVLGPGGGALAKMVPAFSAFAGGALGDGRQWMSWIHRDDAVGLIIRALQDEDALSGVYNATAPTPVRMNELCQALGNVMGRPSWLPVPELAIQLLLGEGAKVVLEGQQVLPVRTLQSGFKYKYADVTSALRAVIKEGLSAVV
jgi:uncharacterized protein (TIGR01777 family)